MEMLTVNEVAEFFKVSRTTVYKMIREGYITPVRLNGSLRFIRKELEDYVNGIKTVPSENN